MNPTTIRKHSDAHRRNCSEHQGVVYRKSLSSYIVQWDGQAVACSLSTQLRKALEAPMEAQRLRHSQSRDRRSRRGPAEDDRQRADPIVVGDQVLFIEIQGSAGQIVEILPRRNYLSRRSPVPMPSARPYEQVIAANVDQVVPVFAAANPEPKWGMLDRYLVSAEAASLPALICITKLDLVSGPDGLAEEKLAEIVREYLRIGYPVILNSAITGEGLQELRASLQGRISILLGKSGVGKTTLLNALQPGLGLRVNTVSQATGKGKHTTTHFEMFPLDFGSPGEDGAIVDTPGVREFGLWDIGGDSLAMFFPEMRPFIGRCKFGMNCLHDEEPGCAIRKAVMVGQISPQRYASYTRLRTDG